MWPCPPEPAEGPDSWAAAETRQTYAKVEKVFKKKPSVTVMDNIILQGLAQAFTPLEVLPDSSHRDLRRPPCASPILALTPVPVSPPSILALTLWAVTGPVKPETRAVLVTTVSPASPKAAQSKFQTTCRAPPREHSFSPSHIFCLVLFNSFVEVYSTCHKIPLFFFFN